ncbi:MAG: hypothetical protein HPY44_20730 [Armatimonadetes bacterium]|nr:hypothetical protein [Armatimonadota bacterium]
MMGAFRAGFASADITPAAGSEMPGGFFKHYATGAHDPLYARAAWFSDGSEALALVSVDCVFLEASSIAEARRLVEESIGYPVPMLIAATHTHTGGPTGEVLMSEADPDYLHRVARAICGAVDVASRIARPAHIRVGCGELHGVAFNRRFRMKNGSVKTNPGYGNPDIDHVLGPADPAVAALGVYDQSGTLFGCIANFTCHTTFMTGDGYSGDYPAWIEQALGVPTVYLPGAIGDVNQCDFVNGRREDAFGPEAARRAGQAIASTALAALESADDQYEPVTAAKSKTLELPLRGPSAPQLQEARELWQRGREKTVEHVYARELVLLHEVTRQQTSIPCELQALRIGDLRVGAASVQPFCQLGLDVKEGFGPVAFCGLANGHLGYVGYRHHYDEGGYELELKRTSKLAPGSGEMLVEALRRELASI